MRILVAEDNPLIQKLISSFLEKLGHESDLATTGIEVLEALEHTSYDLVLMDVQMPKMDGFEATVRIRRRFPEAQRPIVVAMTAHAVRGYRRKCAESGMDDYLSKPLKLADLQTLLERVEEGRATAREQRGG